MTHMRYWAMSLATAICGTFLAIERFAFAPSRAVWIAFGVTIAATLFSLAAFLVALLRENHSFSGISGLSAMVAGWTIITTRTFTGPSALWLAFAGGVALLLMALPALALHETTIERVVYSLAPAEAQAGTSSAASPASASGRAGARALRISAAMRSWMYWLTHTGLALAGSFVVLLTFALGTGHHHASVRWITFGIGIAATCMALGALLERGLASDFAGLREGLTGRVGAIMLTAASGAVGVAMIVTMLMLSGSGARWVAFALGCAMAGASLAAAVVHEFTSERVRHELEIATPAVRAGVHPTAAA